MYENGKMIPVETIPGMGGGRIKENDGGVNSTMIHCRTFVNITMYLSTTIIQKKISFSTLKTKGNVWY
jgi:hypothetical protein